MECTCRISPGHIYAAIQRAHNALGTLRGISDLRGLLSDGGYLWRRPTDEEWAAMEANFRHYLKKPRGGEGAS